MQKCYSPHCENDVKYRISLSDEFYELFCENCIPKDIAERVEKYGEIKISKEEKIKKSTAKLIYALKVECPYCDELIDLTDEKYEGDYIIEVFSDRFEPLKGRIIGCDFCGKEFEIQSMDII